MNSVFMEKPFAPSCERNMTAILDVLNQHVHAEDRLLFEVASGTGQHAVGMAPEFPHLRWQTSDLLSQHEGICQWIDESGCENVARPIHYESGSTAWPLRDADLVFSANSLHIMSWQNCLSLFEDLKVLKAGARVLFYGPFNYQGSFTSESNEKFSQWLFEQSPHSAIRDFESVDEALKQSGFELLNDHEMPANNRVLVYSKIS